MSIEGLLKGQNNHIYSSRILQTQKASLRYSITCRKKHDNKRKLYCFQHTANKDSLLLVSLNQENDLDIKMNQEIAANLLKFVSRETIEYVCKCFQNFILENKYREQFLLVSREKLCLMRIQFSQPILKR